MTVVVLGAGVIGVTTAYYLARDGHQVVVVDRQSAAGLETSFANGGLVTPSMADPWAAPGIPALMAKHFGREDAPFLLRLRAVPGLLAWGVQFLRNCRKDRWRANTETVLRLALYSRDTLDALSGATGIAYDRCDRGTLRIYRDAADLAEAAAQAEVDRALGLDVVALDGRGCVALEPALRPIAPSLAGGLHFPEDRSGDCLMFTQALAKRAADLGVEFRHDTRVAALEADGDRIAAVATDRGRIAGDRFVLACGSYSRSLAGRIGVKLPVQPVKGYSATLPVGGWNNAPTIPLVDHHRKIAVTRLGNRLRLAGTAEFAGFDHRDNPRRGALLLRAFADLFPDYPGRGPGGDPGNNESLHWHGLRPMTPDGRPILGRARHANLFFNVGHGPLGWTLACGSARATAALVAGREPELALDGFAIDRFQ